MKFLSFSAITTCILISCFASPLIAGESTLGANELLQEFSTCQTSSFVNIAANRAKYEKLGAFKSITENGIWFDTKLIEKDSVNEIYRFEKPIKINGLTATAAGYSYFKGSGQGYSGGDATYWGLYFAETPKEVFAALRGSNPMVAAMRFMGDHYVNMKVLQHDGEKRFDQGAIIEADSTQEGAKSYFNCSIQYKILEKSNAQKQMSKEDESLLNELVILEKTDLLKLCFEDASKKSTADIHKAAMACSALNKKR
ncbi:MAG: hypothetical protein KIS62_09040 [Ramlibacter sp.]|nr:hypothetical protein [Ramlibacter sp.]